MFSPMHIRPPWTVEGRSGCMYVVHIDGMLQCQAQHMAAQIWMRSLDANIQRTISDEEDADLVHQSLSLCYTPVSTCFAKRSVSLWCCNILQRLVLREYGISHLMRDHMYDKRRCSSFKLHWKKIQYFIRLKQIGHRVNSASRPTSGFSPFRERVFSFGTLGLRPTAFLQIFTQS